jgi:hypothetical protein
VKRAPVGSYDARCEDINPSQEKPMIRALMDALVRASSELQEANRLAREGDREDICQLLRQAQWKTAAAIADLVPDAEEVTS